MRTIAKAALCLFAALLLASAQGQEATPDALVKNVTLEVVELIAKDKEIRGNRNKLIELINEKVLPHFNFAGMTALAMGQSWNKADAGQKKRLTEEFKILLVRTYASALAAFAEQKFEFRPLRAKPTETDVTVTVRVLQPGAQPVPIDYSMEKTASGCKVYDGMGGGVGLVANYRTAFYHNVLVSVLEYMVRRLSGSSRTCVATGG